MFCHVDHYGMSVMILLLCNILHTGELPVTIDFARYDRNPGYHNITIVANSTLGEMDDFTHTFLVEGANNILYSISII